MLRRISLLLTMMFYGSTLASADVYKCPDRAGKIQYQNMPCDDAAPMLESGPPSTFVPVVRAPREEPPALSAPPLLPPAPTAPAPRPRSTTPLDTKTFGLLTVGMSEATVRARVGEPDDITDKGMQLVGGIGRGRVAVKEVHTTTWAYFGDSQILDSFLTFADGILVSKEKVQR